MSYQTLCFADVSRGDRLPTLEIPITTSLISCAAIATRDFEPCHHDRSVAQGMGLPDVFMNILTSQALMTRFVTDWSGPEAVVRKVELRLGAPNVPGVTMTINGTVTGKDEADRVVSVEVTGENEVWGMHMSGTVRVALPDARDGSAA